MAHYQASIESRRTPAETFDYLATFSNAAQWDPGVLTAEPLDPGPVAVGSRFRLVLAFLGRKMSLTYAVTQYVAGREVTLIARNWLLQSTDQITVAAAGEGARVTYDADIRLQGALALLDPLMARGFPKVAERAVAGLTRELSAAQAPHPG